MGAGTFFYHRLSALALTQKGLPDPALGSGLGSLYICLPAPAPYKMFLPAPASWLRLPNTDFISIQPTLDSTYFLKFGFLIAGVVLFLILEAMY